MRSPWLCLVAAFGWSMAASAANQTLSGKISDSMCGESHKAQAEHGKSKMSDRECTLACIKKGGKYVLAADGKVYHIENQAFADLKKHAGHTVKVSGEVKDNTITVSKIEMEKGTSKTSE